MKPFLYILLIVLFSINVTSLTIGKNTNNFGVYINDTKDITYWNDLTFPLANTRINPVTNKPDIDYENIFYLFDPLDKETIWGSGQSSHAQVNNTPFLCHIHWMQYTIGNVTWELNYSLSNENTNENSWFIINNSRNAFNYINGTLNQISYFTSNTTNVTDLSAIFRFKLSRLGGDINDNYPIDANFTSFDCHYELDALGSKKEMQK